VVLEDASEDDDFRATGDWSWCRSRWARHCLAAMPRPQLVPALFPTVSLPTIRGLLPVPRDRPEACINPPPPIPPTGATAPDIAP